LALPRSWQGVQSFTGKFFPPSPLISSLQGYNLGHLAAIPNCAHMGRGWLMKVPSLQNSVYCLWWWVFQYKNLLYTCSHACCYFLDQYRA